jgi:hypothetical protein
MQSGTSIPTRARHADVGIRGGRVRAGRRRSAPLLGVMLALLACPPALGDAPEFSAEAAYVAAQAGPQTPVGVPPKFSAKLYVSKDKMRIDFAGLSRQSLIIDDAGPAIVALFHDRKTYQALGSRPAEYFRVADAENACPAWQRAAGKPIRCQKAGTELVGGRTTVRYTRLAGEGVGDEIWVDPTLQYVVKWRVDAVEMELRNISVGPQPPDLFVVPEGFAPAGPRNAPHRQPRRP